MSSFDLLAFEESNFFARLTHTCFIVTQSQKVSLPLTAEPHSIYLLSVFDTKELAKVNNKSNG